MIVVNDLAIRGIFMGLILLSILIGLWNAIKIREIHLSMNSRLDQLLITAKGEAHAAGVLEERGREVAERASSNRQDELDEATKALKSQVRAML